MKLPLRGAVAVVTGAASGIGRSTALALAGRGCHLALVDVNADGLANTAGAVAKHPVRCSQHHLDLTDADGIAALPDAVVREHGRVTVLLNVAGAALVGRFEEVSLEEFRWLMETNFFSVVGLTKSFLPVLSQQPAAQIVNVSSLFGIIAPPEQAAYAASKFAVRGFSEALRHELAGSSIGVTVVHPGGVKTAIARSARFASGATREHSTARLERFERVALRLPPERAAEAIADAIERRLPRLLVGSDAWLLEKVQRLMPGRYWSFLARGLKGRQY